MFKKPLYLVVFLVGLLAVVWIGAGYVISNPVAALVALVIAACYLAGALELHRYQQATATLTQALAHIDAAREDLAAWLGQLHPGLRSAVRLRIEGERVPMPAPSLTPYLVGLLVLLGMLGTLLGMMATLRGTGLALESAADLQAIRGSLAAPVKGLGFAFGTSIAGVASSAMLGLLSALCRRERLHAVQRLDGEIATTLYPFSQAYERREVFRLLQQQVALMPTLIDRLQSMSTDLEQRSQADADRQHARQEQFHQRTEAAYTSWSSALGHSLQASVADSSRAVGAALQPIMEATMATVARDTASLQQGVTQAVQQQLDGLTAGFANATSAAAAGWDAAIGEQRRANDTLAHALGTALLQFNSDFGQHSAGLLEGVATRLEAATTHMGDAWQQALSRQDALNAALTDRNAQALSAAAATIERQSAAWVQDAQQSRVALQDALAAQDQQRLDAWTAALASAGNSLRQDWSQAGESAAARQQDVCDVLAGTARELASQAHAQASATIAEVSRLVQTAMAAPQAAAEVIGELRQNLSQSMARDTSMLAERTQMMETLQTLLAAVNHASTEQRTAIDALVTTSADLLDRVGGRFAEQVEAEAGRLDAVSAQIAVGASEVASLGEAFGISVQHFGEANEALVARLQGIENVLAQSLSRSDEQLAYYVAQAREVVDLSVLAQRQIVEELRQATARGDVVGAEPA
ncbi:MAG TPA: DUF802 domain-containing protein [Stenotrophomonas sp.]